MSGDREIMRTLAEGIVSMIFSGDTIFNVPLLAQKFDINVATVARCLHSNLLFGYAKGKNLRRLVGSKPSVDTALKIRRAYKVTYKQDMRNVIIGVPFETAVEFVLTVFCIYTASAKEGVVLELESNREYAFEELEEMCTNDTDARIIRNIMASFICDEARIRFISEQKTADVFDVAYRFDKAVKVA